MAQILDEAALQPEFRRRQVARGDKGPVQSAMRRLKIEYYRSEWVKRHRWMVEQRLARRAQRRARRWLVPDLILSPATMIAGLWLFITVLNSWRSPQVWAWFVAVVVGSSLVVGAGYAVHRYFYRRRQDEIHLAEEEATWKTVPLGEYRGVMPDPVFNLVLEIRAEAPEAEFELEVIEKPLYVMLAVVTVGHRYVICTYGPPNYND